MSHVAALPGSPAPPLSERLWQIVGGLRRALAALGGRDRAAVPLMMLAWTRAGRLATRFAWLLARLEAGTLAPPRVRVYAPRAAREADAGAAALPRGFGWTVRLMQESACYGSQLQALLAEPEMAALLRSCPRAGRILRPLCHMLGVVWPGTPVRDPKPMRAGVPAGGWWQQAAAVCPAPPIGYEPFPPRRAPPGWRR